MHAADPFVSIVTVSLNAADTIGDTISSISQQELSFPIEHICVDGGSCDATRGIIDDWAARLQYVKRVYEPDLGIYDAMNKGLRACRGEYVLFLNADDFLTSPHTLAMAMADLRPGSADNPDLVLGDVVMGNLGVTGFWRHRRVPRLLHRLRGAGLFAVHQGRLTKRRLLEQVGGFDPASMLAADVNQYYDLERRASLSMRVVHSDIAFMRAGGAANAGVKAKYRGTAEIYRHLLPTRGFAKASLMVMVKTLQSLTELRYGAMSQRRWFLNR